MSGYTDGEINGCAVEPERAVLAFAKCMQNTVARDMPLMPTLTALLSSSERSRSAPS